ncbi:NAD-dependent glycerol-3-phosphate dehydrogenase N-terminus [Popillia japonica]|uniref:NAD-dependent glycerol-3-phosphate dehydrogenase N-terminus n=1 Tax=Popillia japonica TaxID=7064 RepID=A0AAW1LPY4_POPJA
MFIFYFTVLRLHKQSFTYYLRLSLVSDKILFLLNHISYNTGKLTLNEILVICLKSSRKCASSVVETGAPR